MRKFYNMKKLLIVLTLSFFAACTKPDKEKWNTIYGPRKEEPNRIHY